jgi:hypothetical protein
MESSQATRFHLPGPLSDLERVLPLLVIAAKIISVTKEKSVDRHEKSSA